MGNGYIKSADIRTITLNEIVPNEVRFVRDDMNRPGEISKGLEVYCLGDDEIKYFQGDYKNGDLDYGAFIRQMPAELCQDREGNYHEPDASNWVGMMAGRGNFLLIDPEIYTEFAATMRMLQLKGQYRSWHDAAEKTLSSILNNDDFKDAFLYVPGTEDFWSMLRYIKSENMCFRPESMIFGGNELRTYLLQVGDTKLAEILNNVSFSEIQKQDDLDWHDALEVILYDFKRSNIQDSEILKTYDFVFEKYYMFRREHHLKPYEAREEVIRMLKEKSAEGI